MGLVTRIFSRILAIAAVLAMFAMTPATASPLDDYRAQGLIVERYDGLVQARGVVTSEIRRLIEEVNAKRRAIYLQRATNEGVSVEAVGGVYAGELAQTAPPGTYFLKSDGSLVRK